MGWADGWVFKGGRRLVWGGDFKSIYDPGHVQLGELSTATLHHAYTTGSATLAQLLQS